MEWIGYFILCVVILAAERTTAQRPYFGSCPKVKSARNVKIDKFLGKWYEVERTFYFYEIPTSCTTLDISRPDNSTKELQVSIKTFNRWTRRPVVSNGKATPKGDGSAVLDYRVNSRLPEFLARFLPGAGRYTLLATDHDTYAVVYSCSDLRFVHADLIWILGRKPDIPVWARAEAYDKLATTGFGTDQLTLTHRKNCPDLHLFQNEMTETLSKYNREVARLHADTRFRSQQRTKQPSPCPPFSKKSLNAGY